MFGADSIVGFLIGLNLVGIFLVLQSVITGTVLKNAKDYHDSINNLLIKYVFKDSNITEEDGKLTIKRASSDGYQYSLSIEGVPGNPLIIYLLFISLLCIFAAG